MSATSRVPFKVTPDHLPRTVVRGLATATPAARGQLLMLATTGAAAGFGIHADGATPNAISLGPMDDRDEDAATGNGVAKLLARFGWVSQYPASTLANDAPTDASFCTPVWDAGGSTFGLLSHTGSLGGANLVNRSVYGVAFGLDAEAPGAQTPYVFVGPIAWILARALLIANAYKMASTGISDAAASTTTAERSISHAKVHGQITSITFNGGAVTASNTDYAVITVSKRDSAGANAVVLGTYDTRITGQGAVTAFADAAFSLSAVAGALNVLESDGYTVTITKGGAGQQLIGEILVNGQVM